MPMVGSVGSLTSLASGPRTDGSVTQPRARIDEGLSRFSQELPLVALGMQDELQDAVRVVVANLAVRLHGLHRVVARPSGANHELSDAALGVRAPRGILGGEPLVVV